MRQSHGRWCGAVQTLLVIHRPLSRLMIHGDRPVIITVIPMWMMQMVLNQVVKVITVGNGLM